MLCVCFSPCNQSLTNSHCLKHRTTLAPAGLLLCFCSVVEQVPYSIALFLPHTQAVESNHRSSIHYVRWPSTLRGCCSCWLINLLIGQPGLCTPSVASCVGEVGRCSGHFRLSDLAPADMKQPSSSFDPLRVFVAHRPCVLELAASLLDNPNC